MIEVLEGKQSGQLTDHELEGVHGGRAISIVSKLPGYTGPKAHVPGSVPQGEINSDSADDNLPDSGGDGIIAG